MQEVTDREKQFSEQEKKLRRAQELNIAFLGSIPIDQRICEDADRGEPFIVEHSNSAASKSFMEIVKKIEDFLKQKATK